MSIDWLNKSNYTALKAAFIKIGFIYLKNQILGHN